MMNRLFLALFLLGSITVSAQDEEKEVKEGGFKKENLFTGGSVSVGFSNRSFQAGVNPVFGYSVADWLDAGIVLNYNYASYRDPYLNGSNDKIRQSVLGGGGFVKLYPVRFLFVQGQYEQNFITQKYIPGNGAETYSEKVNAPSLLLGAGYTTNRYPGSGQPHFYLAVLFDVLNRDYSPYTDGTGRLIPILRAGVQVPLFNGGRDRYNQRYR